jgi:hypothetical protein
MIGNPTKTILVKDFAGKPKVKNLCRKTGDDSSVAAI